MNDSFKCKLIIRGEDLDSKDILSKLNLEPTRFIQKGVQITSNLGDTQTSSWVYQVKATQCNTVLKKMVSSIKPRSEELNKIMQNYDVFLRCYVQSDLAQIQFDLSPEVIRDLSTLKLRLEFSILSWGGVEE